MTEYVTVTPRTRPLYRGTQVVWYILGVIEVLLAFRFILKLLGANTGAAFTQLIYALSDFFVAPFLYVFRISAVGGAVFEWPTLLAMVVYWIIAWALIRLFTMSRPVSDIEAHHKLEQQDGV